MLILVGNEPRTFREALASLLGSYRPMDRVLVIAPEQLGSAVIRLTPEVVVCDPHVGHTAGDSVWIELDGTELASPHTGEEQHSSPRLHEILETIDRAAACRRMCP